MQSNKSPAFSQLDLTFGVDDRARRQRLKVANAIPSETDVDASFHPSRPNDETNLGGEPNAVNANEGARDSFESNSGEIPAKTTFQNPSIDEMSGIQNQISDIRGAANYEANMPVSGRRKVAGALAGIGMGMLTADPLAGFGVYQAVTQHPAAVVRQREQQAVAPLQEQMGSAEKIAGLQNTFGQRQAEVQGAENQRADVTRQGQGQQFDQAHPELYDVNAQTGMQSPKRAGTTVGPAVQSQPPVAPQGAFEMTTNAAGNFVVVNKTTGAVKDTGEKAPPNIKWDEFSTYVQTRVPQAAAILAKIASGQPISPEDQNAMQAAEEAYAKSHQTNFAGANAADARAAETGDAAAASEIAGIIDAHLNETKVNRNDPNAYKAAVAAAITEYGQARPEDQAYLEAVRKQLLTVTPTRPPASSGGGLGAILAPPK